MNAALGNTRKGAVGSDSLRGFGPLVSVFWSGLASILALGSILILAVSLSWAAQALGQDPPVEDPGQELLDDRQEEEDRQAQIEARPGLVLEPADRIPDVEDPFCFEFDNIIVEGVTLLRPAALTQLVAGDYA